MAGKIIADTIESAGSQISLNVGNVTILTASSTGLTLIPTTNVNVNLTNSIVNLTSGNVTNPSLTFSGNTSTGIYMPAANTIAFTTAGTEDMRITSTGLVGIGTNSPTYGTLEVAQGSAGVVSVINNTVGDWAFRKVRSDGSNGMGIYDVSGFGVPAFYASGSERMRIDSSGRVGIGTTTPGRALSVQRSNDVMNVILTSSSSSQESAMAFVKNGVEVGYINCTLSSTVYGTSSDYRLKDNVALMSNALEKISALRPVTYTWKVDGLSGQGFIAHELQEHFPEAVSGEKDAVDEEGNPKYQGIDTSFLVATLTAAIQELKAIVDAQAVEIAALKAK